MKNKFLTLLGVFCLVCTFQVWGYDFSSGKYLFLDNTNCEMTTPHLRIGRSGNTSDGTKYTSAYAMTHISNTNLWYYQMSSKWEKYEAFTISNNCGWTKENTIYQPYNSSGTIKPNDENTITTQLVYQKYAVSGHVLLKSTSQGDLSDNCQYWNAEKSDIGTKTDLNRSVTVKILLSEDGGSTYSETSTYYGDLSASRYTFGSDSYEKVNQSKKDLSSSDSNVTSALSATISFTESNTTAGYIFKGWGETKSAIDATAASWDYLCTGTKTVYVYFMLDTKNLVVVSEDENKGMVEGSVSDIATFNNPYTIKATPKEGYEFDKWAVTNGEVTYADGTIETDATAKINISDNVGIQATFKAPLTVYFVPSKEDAENENYHFTANLQYTSDQDKWKVGEMTKVEDALYHCRPIYKFETEFTSKDYTIGYIQFQTYDGTTFKHQTEITSITTIAGWQGKMATAGGNVSDYTTEACYDLTVASEDDAKGGVNKTSITTYPNNKTEITATPQYGYAFDKWVGSNGVSFDDETKATTNVSATKAGTVTATFKNGPLEAGVWTQWKDNVFPSTQFMRVKSTDHIAVATVEITDATKTYDFKYSKIGGNWYGNTGYITPATTFESWWSFENISGKSEHDQAYYWCHIQPSGTGTLIIKINLDEDRIYVSMPYDLKITSAGYASFYGENNLTIPDGLTVKYITDATEEEISWVEMSNIIPKHTGVILSGEPGTYTAFTTTDVGSAAEGNLLLGTDEQTEIADNGKPHYVLSNGEFGVGMYFPNFATVDNETGIGKFTNGAHKSYLELNETTSAPRRLIFEPRQTPTSVDATKATSITKKVLIDGQLYIMQGEKKFNAQGQIIK